MLWVEHTVVEGAEFCVRWSGWQPCLFVEEVHGLVAELEAVNAGLLLRKTKVSGLGSPVVESCVDVGQNQAVEACASTSSVNSSEGFFQL